MHPSRGHESGEIWGKHLPWNAAYHVVLPLRHQDLSRITIEDVFITGDLAEKCSVARVHHPGFVYNINLKRGDVVSHLAEAVARVLLCRSWRGGPIFQSRRQILWHYVRGQMGEIMDSLQLDSRP